MESDGRLWVAAQLLLAKHGEGALPVAHRHAKEWVARQDPAAASLWQAIAERVERLSLAGAAADLSATPLPELLGGTVTRQVMAADRVSQPELERLLHRAKHRRR